jgi:hypothetical protein
MRSLTCMAVLCGVVATVTAPAALADTLLVERLGTAQATAGERPTRGMGMDQVARRWGEPTAREAAVGQPPITRWAYPGFTVVFEYQHVVHAVVRQP